MDTAALRAAAPPGVRFVERFVTEGEAAALFRRADLAVLPYREIEQSGVLFTALGFAVPLVLTDVGGFPEVAAAGAAELVAPGDAAALHDALVGLLEDPARRATPGDGRRCAWPTSATAGTRSRARTSSSTPRCWRDRDRPPSSGSPSACSPTRRSATRCCSRCSGRARRGRPIGAAPDARRAVGVARRRRPPRGRDHRGEGAPTRSRSTGPPSAWRSSSPATARPTTPPARARAAGRRRRARPAAGRQGARPGRRRSTAPAASCWPSPTPTRCGSPARCARWRRPSRTRGRATPAGRCASSTTGAPTRRACTGATRWPPRARVAAGVGHRRQRRDLRRAPGGLPARRPGHGPRPLAALQHRQARLARGLRPGGARDREDGAHHRGRVRTQAAHDEPRVADRPARRPALPARLPAALRADGRLAPAAALRHAVPARRRAGRQRRAARQRPGLRRDLRRSSWRCSPPRSRGA